MLPNASPEIVALDRNGQVLSCAVKTVSGDGLRTLRRWLGDGSDALLLHNGNGEPPLVLVGLKTWHRLAKTVVKGVAKTEAAEPCQQLGR